MNNRNSSNTRYLASDNSTPLNPFLKTIRKDKKKNQYFQKSPAIRSRSRSSSPTPSNFNKPASSFISLKLIFPIILIICILLLFYFIVFTKNDNLLFCSDDVDSKVCIECPEHGKCKAGHLLCDHGYLQVDYLCVPDDNTYKYDEIKLYSKMKKFIASNINSACTSSNIILYENLEKKFGNSKFYQEALNLLRKNGMNSEYKIEYIPPDGFIAHQPILNARCKVQSFYNDNIITLFLFLAAIVLTVILFFVTAYNQKTNRQISRCSREVVRDIRRSQRGEFKYASEYTLSVSNPMSKFWDRIADEVERNPSVTVLKSVNGKKWGYV